jgi:hypothetical protein
MKSFLLQFVLPLIILSIILCFFSIPYALALLTYALLTIILFYLVFPFLERKFSGSIKAFIFFILSTLPFALFIGTLTEIGFFDFLAELLKANYITLLQVLLAIGVIIGVYFLLWRYQSAKVRAIFAEAAANKKAETQNTKGAVEM